MHALSGTEMRSFLTTDLKLASGRLETRRGLLQHTVHLEKFTRQLVSDWITYRHDRWPASMNPHLLVSQKTALDPDRPAISLGTLRGHLPKGVTLDGPRQDRILNEAMETADPLRLMGITEKTACGTSAPLTRNAPQSCPADHRAHEHGARVGVRLWSAEPVPADIENSSSPGGPAPHQILERPADRPSRRVLPAQHKLTTAPQADASDTYLPSTTGRTSDSADETRETLVGALAEERLNPQIAGCVPLDEPAQAHRLADDCAVRSRVMVVP